MNDEFETVEQDDNAGLTLIHDGKTYIGWSEPALQQAGIPQNAIDTARATGHALEQRRQVRRQIAREVADTESLLGTTADGAALALYGLSMLIKILAEHGSASVKTALSDAADGQLVALATDFLAKIDDGSIKLTALEKGLASVVADIGSRSTGVSRILAGSSGANSA